MTRQAHLSKTLVTLVVSFMILSLLVLPAHAGVMDQTPSLQPTPTPLPVLQFDERQFRLDGPPPAVGSVILEDALTSPGVIPGAISCPTGRNSADFTSDGYLFTVTGRCRPQGGATLLIPAIEGLIVADGEVRVEAKVIAGGERVNIELLARQQADPPRDHTFSYNPALSELTLFSTRLSETPAFRLMFGPVPRKLPPDSWHNLAVRLNGPEVWVLVNDDLVLSFADPALRTGGVSFGISRRGQVKDDDTTEISAIFRNLRVSRLAV